jgi:hypothetical protein
MFSDSVNSVVNKGLIFLSIYIDICSMDAYLVYVIGIGIFSFLVVILSMELQAAKCLRSTTSKINIRNLRSTLVLKCSEIMDEASIRAFMASEFMVIFFHNRST